MPSAALSDEGLVSMKLECNHCQTRYTISDEKIPPRGAKIRCRKCGTVIPVPPITAPAPLPVVPPAPEPAPQGHVTVSPPANRAAATAATAPSAGFSFFEDMGPKPSPPPPAEAPPPAVPATPHTPAPSAGSVAAAGDLPPEEKARHDRARRLARVLASDIAIYNRDKKDRGLAEGNLVSVLGYEIKKSWEIYKERVGADFANTTPYFRDALNDLLAEGQKIF